MASREGLTIPARLAANCRLEPRRVAWLERLPSVVRESAERWSLTVGAPFDGPDGGAAWVAPVVRAGGAAAVLKVGMPHMESEHELAGLRVWDGGGVVRVLEADEGLGAMLLERCLPGSPLRALPEPEQDAVIAGLLRRLWRVPVPAGTFRPLAAMTRAWANGARRARARVRPGGEDPRRARTDPPAPAPASAGAAAAGSVADPLVDDATFEEALELFDELPRTADRSVLLATDLHAGNVLRAEREPWLVIDPKPYVGDPAYDATQHLLNTLERLRRDPHGTVERFADLLQVDAERVRLWTFARLVHGGVTEGWRGAADLAARLRGERGAR